MSTTYRVGSAASGADRSVHLWTVSSTGRFGAHKAVTLCPPSPYGVAYSGRPGEHPDLASALETLNGTDEPCVRCTVLVAAGTVMSGIGDESGLT